MSFFDELQTFSERVFDLLGISERRSPWHSVSFADGSPVGAILHYTASSEIQRALRWFMVQEHNARVSAHAVVADGWPDGWLDLADGLDEVRALPAAVVQCVPPDFPAWHATWVNERCYGIEMVNAGLLKPDGQGGYTWWANDWTQTWESPKVPVPMYGRYWEPYTVQQVAAVIMLLRRVQQYHCGTLDPTMVLGHEQVDERKLDPGPLFPLHGVREAMLSDVRVKELPWFVQFAADRQYGVWWREQLVREWWCTVMDLPSVSPEDAQLAFHQVLRSQFLKKGSGFGIFGKLALRLLGYAMSRPAQSKLEYDESQSVRVFQRMMHLKVDGIPGVQTKAGIVARLSDRGLVSPA